MFFEMEAMFSIRLYQRFFIFVISFGLRYRDNGIIFFVLIFDSEGYFLTEVGII